MFRDLVDRRRLQIAHHRFGTGLPKIVALLGAADQPHRLVTTRGEQPLQPQRDLTMTSSDDNAHVFDRTPAQAHPPNDTDCATDRLRDRSTARARSPPPAPLCAARRAYECSRPPARELQPQPWAASPRALRQLPPPLPRQVQCRDRR
ncbi:hypothetical protein GCM10010145_36150 [Streptomyces ruber]|uniref:Uncharacterized protein n=2 Tax=Streptomyces TaxID=1883 RepID=A0A918BEB0_9ACTN|nr:hypothetical protein GCM10010145_36150 [Streptomyces ruber]